LAAALDSAGFYPQTAAICGVMADKDYPAMIRALAKKVDLWFAVAPPVPGALAADDLAAAIIREGGRAEVCESTAQAAKRARAVCGESDRIAVFGSFHTIAAFREAAANDAGNRRKNAIAG
jgi:dihydrofolate synthase/folylpolyglutamate synthase